MSNSTALIMKMAARNIGRNRRRTLLTAITVMMIVLLLIFMLSYLQGMLNQGFDLSARLVTGHVKISAQGYADKETLMPLELAVSESGRVAAAAARVPGVTVVTRRIKFFTMVQFENQNEFPVVMGIEPGPERQVLGLDQNLARGRYFQDGKREAILGVGLAKKLGIIKDLSGDFEPGSKKAQILAPRGVPMSFAVVGLARFGYALMDDKMMFLRFADAQYAADQDADDMASEILVLLSDRNDSFQVLPRLRESAEKVADTGPMEFLPWQSQGWLYSMLKALYVSLAVIVVIFFFIAGSTVVNTMLMAVLERTREIGMLKALGLKNREVIALFMAEATAIGILGGLIGMGLGVAVSLILQHTGIPVGEAMANMPIPMGNVLQVKFIWWFAPASLGFGLIMTALATLWPAVRAGRMPPGEALRII